MRTITAAFLPTVTRSGGLHRLYCFLSLLLPIFLTPAFGQQSTCAKVQEKVDAVSATGGQAPYDSSWADLERMLGKPSRAAQTPYMLTMFHDFAGCSVEFTIGNQGKILSKKFHFGLIDVAPTLPAAASPNELNLARTVLALQATVQQLQVRIAIIETLLRVPPRAPAATKDSAVQPSSDSGLSITPAAVSSPVTATGAGVASSKPVCAENGSCYGDIIPATGQPKTVHVDVYDRKDGTHVRGYYRSAPRK